MEDIATFVFLALIFLVSLYVFKTPSLGAVGEEQQENTTQTMAPSNAGRGKVIVASKLAGVAKALHAALPVRNGIRSICLSGNGLFASTIAEGLKNGLSKEDIACLVDLYAIADVFLIFLVRDDDEKARVLAFLMAIPELKWDPIQHTGIQPHRVLFCTTVIGKIALVRQIEPLVLIEEHPEVAVKLRPFVTKVVFLLGLGGDMLPPIPKDNVEYFPSLLAYYDTFTS
ncbi:hypothetical protein THRCLA_05791 [Thraustotheca clavata]|uniref:Secreted protein n=1 Tax=Thraustotheca clavata TaxID=74557 RepID=A0A1V9ZST4_9STRA|nr:hypothetical protein THRCLA_05791 [Thraustotheca clavata]